MIATSGTAALAFDVTVAGGVGADVLLIHAAVTDRRSWATLVPELAGQRRVVAYDARGFGETTSTPEPHSPVRDAIAVMDAAGLERAVIIGASRGGRTAVNLALTAPDRVAGLVLIGSTASGAPFPEEVAEPADSIDTAAEAAADAGDFDEANRLEAHLWLDGPSAAEGRVGGAARDLFLSMNDRALHAESPGDEVDEAAAWSRLGELTVPTLVLAGDLDIPELQVLAQQMAALIPHGRFVSLAGVAHLPHLEGDDATTGEIVRFLAEV